MSMSRGLAALTRAAPRVQARTYRTIPLAAKGRAVTLTGPDSDARKLSAVDRCIEILSDSMGKLPNYLMDSGTRERVGGHPLLELLNVRPNEAMTPSARKKALETSRLEGGNGYDWIVRDPRTGAPAELIPLPWYLVDPWLDTGGRMWYTVTHPLTGEPMVLPSTDVCHYKGASRDGLKGVSVLQRASEVISAGKAAQEYDLAYYENGGQPAGILKTDADLGKGKITVSTEDGGTETITHRELVRREWEAVHKGPNNSHRVAILDLGTDYKPISATNAEAQFVENKEVSVKDIARYFGVPLYKLQEGKQAYGSNEQNAIEYVVSTLHPIVTQYEEEQTWKLLTLSERGRGLELRINMMAELKGDTESRASWYRAMREMSVFSPNDIRALEDMPDVEGGEDRYASLNYVPLARWGILSENRNEGSGSSE